MSFNTVKHIIAVDSESVKHPKHNTSKYVELCCCSNTSKNDINSASKGFEDVIKSNYGFLNDIIKNAIFTNRLIILNDSIKDANIVQYAFILRTTLYKNLDNAKYLTILHSFLRDILGDTFIYKLHINKYPNIVFIKGRYKKLNVSLTIRFIITNPLYMFNKNFIDYTYFKYELLAC